MGKNKNSILGTYHTNLRNIGLFSSLSIGILTFSRNAILKKDLTNKALFGVGIAFLLISFILSIELKKYANKNEKDIGEKLMIISKIINYALIIFLTTVIYSVLHRIGVF
jgi:hypothetical protein